MNSRCQRVDPTARGTWERISWDVALATITKRIATYKKHGLESVVFGHGTGQENEAVGGNPPQGRNHKEEERDG